MNGSHWNGSVCESCGIADCLSCSKAKECDTCFDGYFLKVTTVLGRKTYTCNKCIDNCLHCNDNTPCSSFQTGFYINNGKCASCKSISHCL